MPWSVADDPLTSCPEPWDNPPTYAPTNAPTNTPIDAPTKAPMTIDRNGMKCHRHHLMPKSRQPSEPELKALTAEFRSQWHAGETVVPWLRLHEPRFRELIARGWSWAGLAAVLTRAGITYQTGRAWTGDNLRCDVYRASRPLKRQQRGATASPPRASREAPASASLVAPQAAAMTPSEIPAGQSPAQAEPKFKPMRLLPAAPQVAIGLAQPAGPTAPKVPRFEAFTLKDQEPPRPLTPEEQQEREAIRKRFS